MRKYKITMSYNYNHDHAHENVQYVQGKNYRDVANKAYGMAKRKGMRVLDIIEVVKREDAKRFDASF